MHVLMFVAYRQLHLRVMDVLFVAEDDGPR